MSALVSDAATLLTSTYESGTAANMRARIVVALANTPMALRGLVLKRAEAAKARAAQARDDLLIASLQPHAQALLHVARAGVSVEGDTVQPDDEDDPDDFMEADFETRPLTRWHSGARLDLKHGAGAGSGFPDFV
ncbi:MAG TPA: hypothetical protein VLJ86_27665 [Ramlibacter sp.]|nr:hypothetical protein [Ramlibacter sp.]